MAAAIDMPVIVTARAGALNRVADVLERSLEIREGFPQFQHGSAQGMKQGAVDVFPVRLPAYDQVGRLLYALVLVNHLADATFILLFFMLLETADHFLAEIDRQRLLFLEDETVVPDLRKGLETRTRSDDITARFLVMHAAS